MPEIFRPQLLELFVRAIFYERTSSIFQQLDTFINYVKQTAKESNSSLNHFHFN